MKHIVTIGGGSGHSQVLKALRDIPRIQITGICPSTDSGGSTGVLQKEYDGSGYTGDLTKCIIALCEDATLAKALSYRYEDGPLHGHSVKNLLFHALEKVTSDEVALKLMWKVCGLGQHRVLPATSEKTELCASLRIGNTISGETNIDLIAKNPLWNPGVHSISDIYLKPEVKASLLATQAVKKADYLIVCPGDLYSSVIPTLLPKGMKQAIRNSKAKIVLFLNIMTKKGETDHYTAADFVEKLEKYLGRSADYIVHNTSPIPNQILLTYSLEQKVELDSVKTSTDARFVPAPLAMISDVGQIYSDPKVMSGVLRKLLK